jgi:hypothetical protein
VFGIGLTTRPAGCGADTVGSQPPIDNLRVVAGERVASASLLATQRYKQGENRPATLRVDGRSMPPVREG